SRTSGEYFFACLMTPISQELESPANPGRFTGETWLTLDELPRAGARRMPQAALEAEVAAYAERHRGERDEAGHALVVRNGRARPRKITLGSGTVEIQAPRVNDRRVVGGERQ